MKNKQDKNAATINNETTSAKKNNSNNNNNNSNNNNSNNNNASGKNKNNLNYLNNINKKFGYNNNKAKATNNNNNNTNNNSQLTNNNNNSNNVNKKKSKMGGNARRGLEPLEFEECVVDSPEFRDNLTRHEKELDHTSHQIKRIIKQVKDLMNAAKVLSTRMKQLADSLSEFNFECIGTAQTDDEMVICDSLKHFGNIIGTIEEEREKMLTLAHKQIIEPLEDFRKKQIGGVKENKKKFDKKTEKFCQSQERFLNMSTKKPENTIQEADASLGMHEREYIQESLSYVLRIQEVQERIKFEFVEILLAFISGWLVFYHTAHEQAEDNRDYLQDLRHKVQKTRENFDEAREKVNELKSRFMEKKTKPEEKFTKRGYLFLMEKKPFKVTWTKYYCTYKKHKRQFTMLQFNQISGRPESQDEKLLLASCQRRASEFEKRFCFDLTFKERPGIVYTFQALSEEDRKAWINVMDGTEPTYLAPGRVKGAEEYQLDETGFAFVRKCIEVLEGRGLEDEGIYRKSGVGTKISKLLALGMDRKRLETLFDDEQYRELMESNTIASALKTYLRNLNEPLMTYRYHNEFIKAAKQDNLKQRVHEVHELVHKLPQVNFDMLDMVIKHLTEVSRKYDKNLMSVFNLGVVFGPTLLRPLEETVAAILDIKFNNIVINILIENYGLIFKSDPNSALMLGAASQQRTGSPSRALRSGQAGSISAAGRPTMYSPQQKVYRAVNKSNFNAEPTMSSSLQNIPNGMNYAHGNGGGGGGANNTSGGHSLGHITTNGGIVGAASKAVGGINMDGVKNLHSMSQSDISIARRIGGGSLEPTYGHVGQSLLAAAAGATDGSGLTAHHATPATASSLWHDYLLAVATPAVSTTVGAVGPNHIHSPSAAGIARHSLNNVSPSTLAMRAETHYGAAAAGSQQQQQQRGLLYAQAKHYSPVAATSTSSSNESVCDSLSSNGAGGGVGGGAGDGRALSGRASLDYVSVAPHSMQHSSQASSLSTLLGSTCDDVVAATAAPSMLIGSGNLSLDGGPGAGGDYAPKKVHRSKDVNQIKRDLSAGTARVRTLYACLGESDGELSFEPNQIITNVSYSQEPGWLQGTLNGETGLIPENYVEHLKHYN